MASIKGRYEWDDDDLTPGKKREGGLHQNLFDREGHLKGSARFIPDDGSDPDPAVIYEPVYMYNDAYSRERERQREEKAELAAKVVRELIVLAAPHAKRMWIEKARPAIAARRGRRADRKAARKALEAAKKPVVVEGTVVRSPQELAVAPEESRPEMTSAEAQARYLAAMAAKAFSEEQMKLVATANVAEGEGLAELEHALAELPPEQTAKIIDAVKANPSVLGCETLAVLGGILGVDRPDLVPIEWPNQRDSISG